MFASARHFFVDEIVCHLQNLAHGNTDDRLAPSFREGTFSEMILRIHRVLLSSLRVGQEVAEHAEQRSYCHSLDSTKDLVCSKFHTTISGYTTQEPSNAPASTFSNT